MKAWLFPVLLISSLTLSGCGALHTAVAKRNLDVQTKMSSSIFLDPVEPQQRTVFVDIRNTSDKPEFDLKPQVIQSLQARGYQVIDSPKRAHYWLQANVLQVGRSNARDTNGALAAGPGAARHVHLVLENDANEAHRLHRDDAGAPTVATAQWNDDLHHALHYLVTGEAHYGYGPGGADAWADLEKALRAHDRLGGHIVSGHVDGTGTVLRFAPVGESHELAVLAPSELGKYLAYKGSITVNGVSLTVNQVDDAQDGSTQFSINLIPHTLQHTTLGDLKAGARVNLEVDLIARYVERMLGGSLQ